MNTGKHPAPSPAIKKDNGNWTFYVFPEGKEREAGQYFRIVGNQKDEIQSPAKSPAELFGFAVLERSLAVSSDL